MPAIIYAGIDKNDIEYNDNFYTDYVQSNLNKLLGFVGGVKT
jgi:hypothetical protein